ncbi:glycoprotein-N-acetylgalactosamine 3-beta-galactosyltransferase 1-like isoform X2 [Lineus longissimus]|uniref:glycoprotein-N-acetylgalactosamine 3-beta-galactosyltransferase 1-like isoform X2 n=1 Tax=Lineus longissimus TaxID=88925 RepID=UPI00315D1BAD
MGQSRYINRTCLISLVCGALFGACFCLMYIYTAGTGCAPAQSTSKLIKSGDWRGGVFVSQRPKTLLKDDGTVDVNLAAASPQIWMNRGREEDIVAKILYNKVRVLCWTMTNPSNYKTKAVHIKATWAKRCNKHIFMSSTYDPNLPTVKLDIQEGRNNLWGKTKAAFKYIYDKHFDEYDWFLKTDDDTYVILENLRHLLSNFNSEDPIYFGRKFKKYVRQGYFSGGAGYVLSRESLRRFVEKGLNGICRPNNGGAEDVELGLCMQRVGVKAGDSRDDLGRERFHPFKPEHHLIPDALPKNFWYWSWVYYPTKNGPGCCSDYAISFHYISSEQMYELEYLVYHVKPFGITQLYSIPKHIRDKLRLSPTKVPQAVHEKIVTEAGIDRKNVTEAVTASSIKRIPTLESMTSTNNEKVDPLAFLKPKNGTSRV